MSDALTQLRVYFEEYPFIRGVLSYAITWPACSIAIGYLEHGKSFDNIDWPRAARFCLFGALVFAPLYYYWLKFTDPYFPDKDLVTSIIRAAFEQVTIGPISLVIFFFVMSLMERQSLEASLDEVRDKYFPSYLAGSFFWPTVKTANFLFISEKNRLVFISVFNFIWVLFLSFMKTKIIGESINGSVKEEIVPQ